MPSRSRRSSFSRRSSHCSRWLIRIDSPGPVFFRQIRIGAAGRTFRIFKFRSMHADADERKPDVAHLNRHLAPGGDPRMFKIVDDPRVTRVGKLLRRFCLDELPQLLNVLVGEMSLVGPRPLILDEDRHVERWARQRLNLKPGVTGLMAGAGAERDSLRRDGPARLPLRHALVADGRPQADRIDDPGAPPTCKSRVARTTTAPRPGTASSISRRRRLPSPEREDCPRHHTSYERWRG